jgi:hypothetical protein
MMMDGRILCLHTYQGGVVELPPPLELRTINYIKKAPILALVYIILDDNHNIIQNTSSIDASFNE